MSFTDPAGAVRAFPGVAGRCHFGHPVGVSTDPRLIWPKAHLFPEAVADKRRRVHDRHVAQQISMHWIRHIFADVVQLAELRLRRRQSLRGPHRQRQRRGARPRPTSVPPPTRWPPPWPR